MRSNPANCQRARLVTSKAQRRLESENAYREVRLSSLTCQQGGKQPTGSFYAAARDAEHQLWLLRLTVLAQLAQQEKSLIDRPADDDTKREQLENMRLDVMEILQNIL